MLISLNDIILIYEKILDQINLDYVSVVVFTNIDVDSLCTLKILTKFFKSQSINYKIYSVDTYTQLQQKIQDSQQYESVKLFMFINCGGATDLTEKWMVNKRNEQGQTAKIFLFDVNKPYNIKNIQSPHIIVIDDEHSQLENRITSQDMKKWEQIEQMQDQDFSQEQASEQQSNQDQSQPNKRSAAFNIRKKMRKYKQTLAKKFNNYYGKTFFSLPTSYCLYRLIRQLHKADNYSLWYAIIGMTSMYLQNYIPKEVLQTLTTFYRSDMIKFNPQNNQKRQKGQIFTKKGYQFPLMNHWSLYESMMNSTYLMVRLNLWNDKGVTLLHEILTKVGIALDQSKQQYKYMLKQLKDSLEQKMLAIAQDYSLTEITYESFMKQIDSSSAYMASDIYYAIISILQKPMHKSTLNQLSEHRHECFWQAYSILDGSQQMLKKSLEEYKQMSQIFMKEAKDIIQRDNIININKVNFTNIRCDTKQKRIFQNPTVLIRFSHMLMGIQYQRKLQNNIKVNHKHPFITSLLDVEKSVCLIVGVTSQMKNTLGSKFNSLVHKMNLPVQHDRFLSNIMIIPKDKLLQFVKQMGNLQKESQDE